MTYNPLEEARHWGGFGVYVTVFVYSFIYMWIAVLPAYVCAPYICSVLEGQKKALNPLRLESQTIKFVSKHGRLKLSLLESSQRSYLLSHLSNLHSYFYFILLFVETGFHCSFEVCPGITL